MNFIRVFSHTEVDNLIRNPLRYKILENYYLLATKQKSSINKAIASFKEVYDKNPDFLPGILGLSTAYMVEKDEVMHQ